MRYVLNNIVTFAEVRCGAKGCLVWKCRIDIDECFAMALLGAMALGEIDSNRFQWVLNYCVC